MGGCSDYHSVFHLAFSQLPSCAPFRPEGSRVVCALRHSRKCGSGSVLQAPLCLVYGHTPNIGSGHDHSQLAGSACRYRTVVSTAPYGRNAQPDHHPQEDDSRVLQGNIAVGAHHVCRGPRICLGVHFARPESVLDQRGDAHHRAGCCHCTRQFGRCDHQCRSFGCSGGSLGCLDTRATAGLLRSHVLSQGALCMSMRASCIMMVSSFRIDARYRYLLFNFLIGQTSHYSVVPAPESVISRSVVYDIRSSIIPSWFVQNSVVVSSCARNSADSPASCKRCYSRCRDKHGCPSDRNRVR